MTQLIIWMLSNALFCIGFVIACIACIGFLIFLRGFLLGLNQLFYIDGHDEHIGEARVRATWGVALMVNMFALWVCIRGVATLFGYDNADQSKTMTVLIIYAVVVALLYFLDIAFKKEKH